MMKQSTIIRLLMIYKRMRKESQVLFRLLLNHIKITVTDSQSFISREEKKYDPLKNSHSRRKGYKLSQEVGPPDNYGSSSTAGPTGLAKLHILKGKFRLPKKIGSHIQDSQTIKIQFNTHNTTIIFHLDDELLQELKTFVQ